ncbi:Arf17p [Orobanche gracilis]
MAASFSARPASHAAVWHAVAGASIHIPPPNSYVYYFPQGHLEQCSHDAKQNSNINLDRPFIHCQVLSVGLFYHPISDKPFAKILLQPAIRTCLQQRTKDIAGHDDNAAESDVVYYVKVLTPSDANNGGGFSVPRSCADLVFPPLNFAFDPPVQNLRMKDARENIAWDFRHIYRGTPRRHLLTTGWSKFVNAKRLIAGDSVVFTRKKNPSASTSDLHREELFIGIRRAGKFSGSNSSSQFGESSANGSSSTGEALEAIERAAKGLAFEVVYYPRVGSPAFVVDAKKVEAASQICWGAGIRVKMDVETEDSTRMGSSAGTVTATVLPESGLWRGSPWRMLQVTWDEAEIMLATDRVSPWDVECISPASYLFPKFPPAKKYKAFPDHHHHQGPLSNGEFECRFPTKTEHGDDHSGNQNSKQTFTRLLTNFIRAEATNNIISETMCQHSENLSPTSRNSCVGVSSFRLFGKTIWMSETVLISSRPDEDCG